MTILILAGILILVGLLVMSNEITITDTLTINKDGTTINGSATQQETLSAFGKFTNVQVIGTSTEQIAFPADLIAEGISHIWLKNLDDTNIIQVGLDTPITLIHATLKPGQTCHCPVNNLAANDPTWYAKALVSPCKLQVVAAGLADYS